MITEAPAQLSIQELGHNLHLAKQLRAELTAQLADAYDTVAWLQAQLDEALDDMGAPPPSG